MWVGACGFRRFNLPLHGASISSDLFPGMSCEASVDMVMVTDVIVPAILRK